MGMPGALAAPIAPRWARMAVWASCTVPPQASLGVPSAVVRWGHRVNGLVDGQGAVRSWRWLPVRYQSHTVLQVHVQQRLPDPAWPCQPEAAVMHALAEASL